MINCVGVPLTKMDACVDVVCGTVAAYMEEGFAGLAGGRPSSSRYVYGAADAGASSAAVPATSVPSAWSSLPLWCGAHGLRRRV